MKELLFCLAFRSVIDFTNCCTKLEVCYLIESHALSPLPRASSGETWGPHLILLCGRPQADCLAHKLESRCPFHMRVTWYHWPDVQMSSPNVTILNFSVRAPHAALGKMPPWATAQVAHTEIHTWLITLTSSLLKNIHIFLMKKAMNQERVRSAL